MTFISRYFPFEYVEDVFSIDYKRLYEKGYRGLVFDIDNTLVPHGADSTKEVDDLFVRIHETGLKTLLLSNNSEARIKKKRPSLSATRCLPISTEPTGAACQAFS